MDPSYPNLNHINRHKHQKAIKVVCWLTVMVLVTLLCHKATAFHLPSQKLDDRFKKISFNEPLRYQITDKKVTFSDINNDPEIHHSWKSTTDLNPTFRLQNQALWLTAAIKNATPDPMTVIVDFANPMADEVDFQVFDNANSRVIKKIATGTDYDFTRRELPYRTFAIEITLQPAQDVNIYLRVVDSGSILAHWNLWNKDVFVEEKLKSTKVDGLLSGALLIFFILNLMVYGGLKERIYLYFAGFIISYTLLANILNGAAFSYLWPNSPEVNQSSVYVAAGLVLLFVSLFSKESINKTPHKIVQPLQYVAILLSTLVIFLPLLAPIEFHFTTLVIVTQGVLAIGAGTAYWRWYKRLDNAELFAIIWTAFLLAGSLQTLSRYGVITNAQFGNTQSALTVIVAAIILSFAQIKRIRTEKSEKEQARTQAAETLQQYFDIYQNAVEGLFTVSMQGELISANPQLVNALGYKTLAELRKALRARGLKSLVGDLPSAKKLLDEVSNKGSVTSREVQGIKKDGSHIWGLMSMRLSSGATDEEEEYIQGAVVDITEKHQAYQKLAYMATHDPLTGMLNRSEFEKKLYDALAELKETEEPSTMLYLDLERFKLINDTSGHTAGDSFLRQIGDQLKSVLKEQGILARLGGDEFAILLPGINGNEAFVIAYRIIEAIKEFRFLWEERIFTVGVSIGMKELSNDDSSLAQIFTSADAACFIAKEKGRNRIHIYSEQDSELKQHQSQMEWISVINDALDKDKFILYHQCIISIDNIDEPIHYEILLRMRDEENNIIPPDTFIPAAERYNLMTNIDRWVIRSYFRWLSQNPAHMKELGMCSINLSGTSIADPHFKDSVQELFVEFLIPHAKICFEITESMAIINLNATLEFVNLFKNLGCKFSLDDFGTGFSSYGYLKNLPVNFVKIDGSFVKDLMVDPIDRAMVNSINEVAKAIGMETVAEFVESDAILQELRVIGVDYAQGFGIHRPSPLSHLVNPEQLQKGE
ncbi:MAG: EAL domain-containing protein [Algicola sp.]|nr:EAL domain-containing protein [Algicola sp.]